MVRASVPTRLRNFTVPDVDNEHKKGSRARRERRVRAADFPGGSILDPHRPPQLASFGLLRCRTQSNQDSPSWPATCRARFLVWGELDRQSPMNFLYRIFGSKIWVPARSC